VQRRIRKKGICLSRRISTGDTLKILKEKDEGGYVRIVWFKTAMLEKTHFYRVGSGKGDSFEY
jgi:hypothetical protein